MAAADDKRLYALLPTGAQRIQLDPLPEPFYDLYKGVRPGIYEAGRIFDGGRMFGFDMHQERMHAGIQAQGFEPALTDAEVRKALQKAIDEFPSASIKLRWDISPEPYATLHTTARMIATLTPRLPLADWIIEKGVNLSLTTKLQRDQPTTKGAAFALKRSSISFGSRENYEPVMVDPEGYLLEGLMSNFGAILRGRLHANPNKVLPGITIRTILELAEQSGLEVVREPIHRDDLDQVEEAFLCSSIRGLVCATKIDGHVIGSGLPGQRIKALAQRYAQYEEAHAKRLWPVGFEQ